jgi:hypothetical protein
VQKSVSLYFQRQSLVEEQSVVSNRIESGVLCEVMLIYCYTCQHNLPNNGGL